MQNEFLAALQVFNAQETKGHRPPGTEDAADRMAQEAQEQRQRAERATVASLQCELADLQQREQHRYDLWADMQPDLVSEDESVALSETGEAVEATGKKRTERIAQA